MRARFTGDPKHGGDGPAVLPFFGTVFVKGEWREIPDALADKVIGHSHFEVEPSLPPPGTVEPLQEPALETPSGPALPPEVPAVVDLENMTKAQLVAYAATLGGDLNARDTREQLLAEIDRLRAA